MPLFFLLTLKGFFDEHVSRYSVRKPNPFVVQVAFVKENARPCKRSVSCSQKLVRWRGSFISGNVTLEFQVYNLQMH